MILGYCYCYYRRNYSIYNRNKRIGILGKIDENNLYLYIYIFIYIINIELIFNIYIFIYIINIKLIFNFYNWILFELY